MRNQAIQTSFLTVILTAVTSIYGFQIATDSDGQIERIQTDDDDAACISDKKKSNGGMDHEGDSWTNRGGSRDGQTAGSAGLRAT